VRAAIGPELIKEFQQKRALTVYASLDDLAAEIPLNVTAYRRLDHNWYIVFYSESD
jgi:hypothetical protein